MERKDALSAKPIITHYDGESDSFTIVAYECKFIVESTNNVGGYEQNKCVTFDGYASHELYSALIDAIEEVVTA